MSYLPYPPTHLPTHHVYTTCIVWWQVELKAHQLFIPTPTQTNPAFLHTRTTTHSFSGWDGSPWLRIQECGKLPWVTLRSCETGRIGSPPAWRKRSPLTNAGVGGLVAGCVQSVRRGVALKYHAWLVILILECGMDGWALLINC